MIFTIPNGSALSNQNLLPPVAELAGIQMPAAWTAADLSFRVSADSVTYQDLYDDAGNEVVVTAAVGDAFSFDEDVFAVISRWKYFQVRSGVTAAPVNQGGDRELRLLTKGH